MKSLLGSITDVSVDRQSSVFDGDYERFSHYAPADEVTVALIEGTPVVALCGKVWVPHRDPQKYKVCPTCKELYEAIND